MKNKLAIVCAALLISSLSHANDGVSSTFNDETLNGPGNSVAGQGGLAEGWGDVNCIGDRLSGRAQTEPGAVADQISTISEGGSITDALSDIVSLGAVVGSGFFGGGATDCSEVPF